MIQKGFETKVLAGDTVDVLVMVYPGAIQLRLDGAVRYTNDQFIDVEIGTYVMRIPRGELRDWSWLDRGRLEVVAGSQSEAWPVERYQPGMPGKYDQYRYQ